MIGVGKFATKVAIILLRFLLEAVTSTRSIYSKTNWGAIFY